MKRTYSASLLITVFTLCLEMESCKKDEAPLNPIVGKWKLTGYSQNGVDVYRNINTCITDNTATFTSDLKLIFDEGPTKCNPSDPQAITETYSFNSDNTQLTVSGTSSSEIYKIQILNSTTLKLELTTLGDIITYTKIP